MRRRQTEIGLSLFLNAEEKRVLLDYLRSKATTPRGRRRLLIVDIMINSGLRAFELCNLRLQNLPDHIGGNAIEVIRGKGNKDRTIPISQRLADDMEKFIRTERRLMMPRYVRRKDPAGFLFYSERRRQMKYTALYQMVRRLGERAGIKKRLRPHKLRHSYATYAKKKVPLDDLRRYLGHRHIATTQRYMHVVDDRDFALAEAIDIV